MSKPSEEGDRRSAQPGNDRRSPHTSIASDGTLIFGDRHGRHWQVYDRRSGDRRGSRVLGQTSAFDRIFINEEGEEWYYELRAEELIDETAFTLERQLADAVRRASGPTQ
jgi:hypothetical protein